MDKNSYIYSVSSALSGRNKAMINDELAAHIDDLTERFIETGYTPEQAEQMAVEKMGNPQIVGANLTKVHSTKIVVCTCLILFFVYAVYVSALFCTIIGWGSDMNLFTIWVEFSFLFLSAISLLLSNRLKNSIPVAISSMFTALFFAGKFILSGFHSVLLYGAYLLFSGNIDDFIIISYINNTLSNNVLLAFSLVFYLLWGLSYAFTFANLSKFNLLKYSKKNVKYEFSFKIIIISALILFTVVTALLFGFKLSDDSGDYLNDINDSYYDGVCIIESDEICDIDEYYYNYESSPQLLYKKYDWDDKLSTTEGNNLWGDNCIKSVRAYNDTVNYTYYTFSCHYVYSEKYVAAVPVHFDNDKASNDFREYSTPCFDNVQWVDTEDTNEITGSLNSNSDLLQTDGYSIELHNVSVMTDGESAKYSK